MSAAHPGSLISESAFTDLKSVSVSSSVCSDVDEQAALLNDWSEVYQQLGSGSFSGSLRQVQFGTTQLFRETTSQRVHQAGMCWAGSQVFAVTHTESEAVRWQGHEVSATDVATFSGNDEFDIVVPAECEILALAIDSGDFQRYAEAVLARDNPIGLLSSAQLINSPGHHSRLSQFLETTLRTVAEAPQVLQYVAAQKSLREALYAQIIDLFDTESASPIMLGPSQRAALVAKVRAYAELQVDDVSSVADMCRVFKVSRRTLQYAFAEAVGMNPVAYLRALRLNAVRKAIKEAGTATPILDTASLWGFWHPSYFSASYKKLFGELPSATLQRPSMDGCIR